MLKFKFVPHLLTKDLVDEKTRASNPEFWDQPYRFTVTKEVAQGYPAEVLYDANEGAIRLLFDTVRFSDRLIDPKGFPKIDACDADSEAISESYEYFEGCLFYYNTEYTLDFLNGRFAQDLNEIMNAFTEFEQGAIWNYLYFLNRQIAKYLNQPVINEKNLHKFASSVYNQIFILDYSTGVISKMIKYIHDEYTKPVKCIPAVYKPNEPPRVPTDIYVPGRAFILFSYLTIYPIKEHVVGQNCIWTDKYDIRSFLYECLGHSIGYFKDRYKSMYKEPEFNKVDLLVKSPGRLISHESCNYKASGNIAIIDEDEARKYLKNSSRSDSNYESPQRCTI